MITINECINAVKSMPNGKSPGSDGYPIEFIKCFGIKLGLFLLNLLIILLIWGFCQTAKEEVLSP